MRDRLEKTALFFKTKAGKGHSGACGDAEQRGDDPISKHFGTAPPADRPESKEWWQRQQRDVCTMTDESELGLMHQMVTISHNDNGPEMLAAMRGGMFATPYVG